MNDADPEPRRGESVQSLRRGLAVIRAFDAEHDRMILSEVARRTDLSRATARRVLLTLVELGYVHTDGSTFALAPAVLELGHAYLSSLKLPEIAQPHLQRLSRELGESSSLAVLDGAEVVYVARVAARRLMRVGIHVGTRFPAHLTSMGRVLLAALPPEQRLAALDAADLTRRTEHTITSRDRLAQELEAVAAQGWSLVDQELEHGLRSLAVPVRTGGRVVAAMNVSSGLQRDNEEMRTDVLPALLRTVQALDADLAHVGQESL